MENTYFGFDWDDNVIKMPTKIVLFKDGEKPVRISTTTFARIRSNIDAHQIFVKELHNCFTEEETGIQINLVGYKVICENEQSFQEFRDCAQQYFLTHLEEAIKNQNFAPAFKHFQKHCETEDLANNTFIITARGHESKTIYKGLILLKKSGLIKFLPKKENIFCVSHESVKAMFGNGGASNPSMTKLNIVKHLISSLEAKLFKFSDDDPKTISLFKEHMKDIANFELYKTTAKRMIKQEC